MTRLMRALILLCSLLASGAVVHAQGAAPAFRAGQYNSTLPSFASGATGYLQMDVNGRLILAPSTSINVGSITGSIVLPTGAATSTNQQTEITALQGLSNRASYGNDYAGSLTANGGTLTGQTYTAGSTLSGSPNRGTSAYTKFSVFFFSTQAGNAYVDGSNDGTSWTALQSVALAAAAGSIVTVPIVYPYLRSRVVNGATAATGTIIQSSLLVN